MSSQSPKNPPALFILTTPRSGSTLFRIMLAGSPHLFVPPELELLRFQTFAERAAALSGRLSYEAEGFLRAISRARACNAEEAQRLVATFRERQWSIQDGYRFLQEAIGDAMLVDKTVSYATSLETLQRAEQLFDGPRYIHLSRHPRAMIDSYLEGKHHLFREDGNPFTPREQAEMIWLISHSNILQFLAMIPRQRQLHLRFEDLVLQPAETLHTVCDFLEIPFNDLLLQPYTDNGRRMVDGIYKGSRTLGDVKFSQHTSINQRVADQWKQYPHGDPLYSETWELAQKLGFEGPRNFREIAFDEDEEVKVEVDDRWAGVDREVPLSFAQERLWFLDQLTPEGSAYTLAMVYRLQGFLDVNALQLAFDELIARHEVLATCFIAKDGRPAQVIVPHQLHTIAVSRLDNQSNETIERSVWNEMHRPFDLTRAPLLRVALFMLSDQEYILSITMHHIVSDAWSLSVLTRELSSLYRDFRFQQTPSLPPLSLQYADFALWQRSWFSGPQRERLLHFWQEQLAGAPFLLELPADFPRPAVFSYQGSSLAFRLPVPLVGELRRLCRQEEATLFMALLTAFQLLLARYCHQEDVLVGLPIANRPRAELEALIGFFVNTLVVRTRFEDSWSFRQALSRVRDYCVQAYAHQDLPFEHLVEILQPERDASRNPLVQVTFQLLNTPERNLHLPDLTTSPFQRERTTTHFDLSVHMTEEGEALSGVLVYSTDLFRETSMRRLLSHYQTLLEALVAQPDRPLFSLSMLTSVETARLFSWGRRPLPSSPFHCVHQAFETRVQQTPQATALVYEAEQMSYEQLNMRANQLAHALLARGIGPEHIVGVCLERSPELIVALLAILKAGAAYLPLDPASPQLRMSFMLQDAKASMVLTQSSLRSRFLDVAGQQFVLDHEAASLDRFPLHNPITTVSPANLAYLLYTSGSTGQPKGAMNLHGGVINLVTSLYEQIYRTFDRKLNVALVASYGFDASVQQIFASLLLGQTLHIMPASVKQDAQLLLKYYQQHAIDISDGTPALLQLLVGVTPDADKTLPVRHFIVGGEALPVALLAQFYTTFEATQPAITNIYGTAECCVDSTAFLIPVDRFHAYQTVPIGFPLANRRVYILDRQLNPVPVGITGDIYLAGAGIGRGYIHRPSLTAERFLPDIVASGEVMYKTGDLGKWGEDGAILFLGRSDDQVNVRGFRIELGEIEAVLRQHQSIRECVVMVRETKPVVDERQTIQYCTRCLLSSTIPGVTLNENGLCNVCQEYEHSIEQVNRYFRTEQELRDLLVSLRARSQGDYDCLLLFSGGKDSTYALYRLVEMGFRVHTFTFDNGFISQAAFRNIERTCKRLKVDHITVTAEHMDQIFVESLTEESSVCKGCFRALTSLSTRFAMQKHIPAVFTGLSRGQIFATKLLGFIKRKKFSVQEIEKELLLYRKMYHSRRDRIQVLLKDDVLRDEQAFDTLLFDDFFRYTPVTKSEITTFLGDRDPFWQRPTDTGFCSTNCLMNDVGIEVHQREKGYRSYAFPLSWEVRLGHVSRDAALQELNGAIDTHKVEVILRKIGYKSPKSGVPRVEQFLCAYLVSKESVTVNELRAHLKKYLPDYMLPATFVFCESFPLNASGKVNRHALPVPDKARPELERAYIAPTTPQEEVLVSIWERVLGLEKVGIEDAFFDLGGHSLQATQIIARAQDAFDVSIPLRMLFEAPTVAAMAKAIEELIIEELLQSPTA